MNESRTSKFRRVVEHRQPTLAVILENVVDTHNLGAVMRSCDSVGIQEVFVIQTEAVIKKQYSQIVLGKKSSAGTRKWLDVRLFNDWKTCFDVVREKYGRIYGTDLRQGSIDLYEMEFTAPIALLFGNETTGISPEAAAACDGHFTVPQVGMAVSLNISVACAVTLYEAYRQRKAAGMYAQPQLSATECEQLYEVFLSRCDKKGEIVVKSEE